MTTNSLTPTQRCIVTFIFRFRFLSRLHIQILLKHKSPTLVKQWLSDLAKKGYLVSERSTKFGENTKPTVYHIGVNGIRLIKTLPEIDRTSLHFLYHESTRSPAFRAHCLTLADVCCGLLNHARTQNKSILFFTKMDYRSKQGETNRNEIQEHDELLQFLHNLNPDGYYVFSGTGIAKQCFLEIIDEHTPSFVLRGRVRKYMRTYQDEPWEGIFSNKFPSIAFLVSSEKKLRSMKRSITMVKNEFDVEIQTKIRCNLALISDIQTKGIAEKIWNVE